MIAPKHSKATLRSNLQGAFRVRKSNALLILLLRSKINADLAQLMTAAEWTQVAKVARVNRPSPETRDTVLNMMRQIETPLAGGIQ